LGGRRWLARGPEPRDAGSRPIRVTVPGADHAGRDAMRSTVQATKTEAHQEADTATKPHCIPGE